MRFHYDVVLYISSRTLYILIVFIVFYYALTATTAQAITSRLHFICQETFFHACQVPACPEMPRISGQRFIYFRRRFLDQPLPPHLPSCLFNIRYLKRA